MPTHSTPEGSPVIALCGPSGVGKGFTKQKILGSMPNPEFFAEPIVVTTRGARHDDGPSRRAGLTDKDFSRLVARGAIVLEHRPFRADNTPWYGFDKDSLRTDRPLLTETHSSILEEFRRQLADRRVLIIGLIATRETLQTNIHKRQPDTPDIDIRLSLGALEGQEIRAAYEKGVIDDLVLCDIDKRDESQRSVVDTVQNYLGGLR